MTFDQFLRSIAPSFMESASLLNADTRYKELSDWNSLTALMIVTTVGQEFGLAVDASVFYSTETLTELYNAIAQG